MCNIHSHRSHSGLILLSHIKYLNLTSFYADDEKVVIRQGWVGWRTHNFLNQTSRILNAKHSNSPCWSKEKMVRSGCGR